MCMAAKVDGAVRIAKQAVLQGKCAVIGLQSTGNDSLVAYEYNWDVADASLSSLLDQEKASRVP